MQQAAEDHLFSEQSLSSKAFQTAKQSYSFYSCIEPREPNPKYKRTFTKNPYLTPTDRLKINTHVLDDLTTKTKAAFERSYLFQPGKQEQDDHFQKKHSADCMGLIVVVKI